MNSMVILFYLVVIDWYHFAAKIRDFGISYDTIFILRDLAANYNNDDLV